MRGSPANEWSIRQARLRLWYGAQSQRELYSKIQVRAKRMLRDVHGVHGLQISGGHPDRRVDALIDQADVGHSLLMAGDSTDDLVACPPALPLASGSMALVILWHALELSDAPVELLAESERVLADDGTLLVVTFRPRGPAGGSARGWIPRRTGCRRLLAPGRIRRWARDAGLELQAESGCGIAPLSLPAGLRRWPAFSERLLWRGAAIRLMRMQKRTIPLTPLPENRAESRLRRAARAGRAQPTCRSEHVPDRYIAHGWRLPG